MKKPLGKGASSYFVLLKRIVKSTKTIRYEQTYSRKNKAKGT